MRLGPLSEPVGQRKYLGESGESLHILENLWILSDQRTVLFPNVSSKINRSCLHPVSSSSHVVRSASLKDRSLASFSDSVVCLRVCVRFCLGVPFKISGPAVSSSRGTGMRAGARAFIQQTEMRTCLPLLHIRHTGNVCMASVFDA